MFDWPSVLRRPDGLSDGPLLDAWFARKAAALLNGSRLLVAGLAHRLVEIEFYLHDPVLHPDPFTHRESIQTEMGRWYFHRTHGFYRGGSFKGLDVTFGYDTSTGGILFRGMETPDGTLIDGPSLCVDHLLDWTGADTVAALDRAIGSRLAWDAANPLRLVVLESAESRPIIQTARVGLTLKRGRGSADPPRFLLRRYRFLTEPRRIRKGKLHLVLALHVEGRTAAEIAAQTGCPRRTVERYLAEFETGRRAADLSPYVGKDVGPAELCRMHGAWDALYSES